MSRALENRLRRWAGRMGWRIEKSRARILSYENHGRWRLLDERGDVRAGLYYELDLDDIEEIIAEEQRLLRGDGG